MNNGRVHYIKRVSPEDYDVVVVGSGISGCVLAERFANLGKKVLVIERREHIGGNCFDYINKIGIRVPKYGPHFFHTNNEKVFKYMSKFTDWLPYEHRVLSFVDGSYIPIPINISTINTLLNLNIKDEVEMKEYLKSVIVAINNPSNSEEVALSTVGKMLYEKLFKNYTKKQWDIDARDLSAEVIKRIPIRYDFDNRYFSDKYQYMPKLGFTQLFKNMLANKNISVVLSADYFAYRDKFSDSIITIFTGRIDEFFKSTNIGKLQYRSLSFRHSNKVGEYFQRAAQINYPNSYKYTRITEPKWATGEKSNMTTIIKEYPTWNGEGYYPVPTKDNQKKYLKYHELAKKLEKNRVYFLGRLARYRYINMDQAFNEALELFEKLST